MNVSTHNDSAELARMKILIIGLDAATMDLIEPWAATGQLPTLARLMSEGVELHPLLVIFGVLAGGEIGGVEGTFLSVPVLSLLRVVYKRIRLTRLSARGAVITTR